jgi:ribosomal protein L16 Arg81 hydroxylase
MREVRLKPGDVLYLPPGTWHSAQAVGHSLAVNMAFNYTKEGSTLELFCDLLYSLLYADPAWRGTPPLAVEPGEDGLPDNVKAFFAERLEDLRQRLAPLGGEDARLAHAWRTRLRSQDPSEKAGARKGPPDRPA